MLTSKSLVRRARDPDLNLKTARKVLTESLGLKKGEALTVETWTNGLPFALDVVKEARRLGSVPVMIYEDEEAYLSGLHTMPKDMLGIMGKHEYGLLSGTDAYVFIPGPPISAYTPKVSYQEFVDSTKYNSSWYEAAKKAKLRGVRMTFGYVGAHLAQLLGKTVEDIVEHQLKAALVDFKEIGTKGREISKYLEDGKTATITTEGMKLTFELKGDLEIQDGITDEEDVLNGSMSYIPPGYVGKDVNSSSVSGKVKLSKSVTRFGLLEDGVLEFKEGKIVNWISKASPRVLEAIFKQVPEASKRFSYVIIGLNKAMEFGYAQDRLPAGSIAIATAFTGIIRSCSLDVEGRVLVDKGRLD